MDPGCNARHLLIASESPRTDGAIGESLLEVRIFRRLYRERKNVELSGLACLDGAFLEEENPVIDTGCMGGRSF